MRQYSGTDKRDPDAITRIDYFLRDVAAALGRITKGETPTGSGVPIGVKDHGALDGLSDDDHAQYALLAGRPIAQTLIGSSQFQWAGDPGLVLRGGTVPGYIGIGGYLSFVDSHASWPSVLSGVVTNGSSSAIAISRGLPGLTSIQLWSGHNPSLPTTPWGGSAGSLCGPTPLVIACNSGASIGQGDVQIVGKLKVRGEPTPSFDHVSLTIKQATAGTSDLTQWVAGDGVTVLSRIDKDGNFFGPGSTLGYVTLDTDQTITGLKTLAYDPDVAFLQIQDPNTLSEVSFRFEGGITGTDLLAIVFPTPSHEEEQVLMVNPMTGVGNLIVGGLTGFPTPLDIGPEGSVLTSTGTVPRWSAGVAPAEEVGIKFDTSATTAVRTITMPNADVTLGEAPANMVTLDTDQTITGEKTFTPGVVLGGPTPVLKQALYPASARAYYEAGIVSGTVHGKVAQSYAETHDASDATYDRIGILGDGVNSPKGTVGVSWTVDECTYAGPISHVTVAGRYKYDTDGEQPGVEFKAQNNGTLVGILNAPSTPIATFDTGAITTKPEGGAWTAAAVNREWGWRFFTEDGSVDAYVDCYVYEFAVYVYGPPELSVVGNLDGTCTLVPGTVMSLDQASPQSIINGIPLMEQGVAAFTLPGQMVNKAYADAAAAHVGFASNYVFCDDIIFPLTTPIWHELERSSDGGTVGSHTADTTSYTELDRHVTAALESTMVPEGIWKFELFCKVSTAGREAQIKADIYRVDTDGAIVGSVLGTAESEPFSNAAVVAIDAEIFIDEQTGWELTDRIGVVLSGKKVANPACTMTWYHDKASGWLSTMETPITLLHNQLKGLNEGDYHHLTAAEYAGMMVNPMTAAGDLIVGGTAGAATALVVGDDDQVLTLKSGTPSWEDAGGGGNAPEVVASFSAKGLKSGVGPVLYVAAPSGWYRISGDVGGPQGGGPDDTTTGQLGTHWVGVFEASPGVQFTEQASPAADAPDSKRGSAVFFHDGGNITLDVSVTVEGEGGGSTISAEVVLERIPVATAPLYCLSAVADVAVDAGATVTLDPVGPTFAAGTEVEVTPVPSSGYHFLAWTGDDTSTDNPLVLTMDAAKAVTATFEAD